MYYYSETSIFGEESDEQVRQWILDVCNHGDWYTLEPREESIRSVVNRMYDEYIDEGDEEMLLRLEEEFGDYIHLRKHEKRKKMRLAWFEFKHRLMQEGKLSEWYSCKYGYSEKAQKIKGIVFVSYEQYFSEKEDRE